jgi:secreted trypsin-like serine protease
MVVRGGRASFRIGRAVIAAALLGVLALLVPSAVSADGVNGRTSIAGGVFTAQGAFPWMVSLNARDDPPPGSAHFCGGSLISERAVLTAGHCVTTDTGGVARASRIVAVIDRARLNSSNGIVVNASRVVRHPQYRSSSAAHDAAIIFLERPVPIAPVPYGGAGSGVPVGKGLALGWGVITPYGRRSSNRLKQATMSIRNDKFCVARESGYVRSLHLCADGGGTRADTCSGDSGGPLLANTPTGWRLVGITSWSSLPCTTPGTVGIYTRVATHAGWINRVLAGGP